LVFFDTDVGDGIGSFDRIHSHHRPRGHHRDGP